MTDICSLYKAGEQEEFSNINKRRKCPFLLLRNQKYDHMGRTGHPMFLLQLSELNKDDKSFTPMQNHWVALHQTVTPLVIWKDLLTATWKGPDILSPWERDMHVFFHRMQKPQSGSQTDLFDLSTKKISIKNPENKEAKKKGERRNMEYEEACLLFCTYYLCFFQDYLDFLS